jgi:hypothetical protein
MEPISGMLVVKKQDQKNLVNCLIPFRLFVKGLVRQWVLLLADKATIHRALRIRKF